MENRGISHRENFLKLQSEFGELRRLGAGPEVLESVATRLLRSFETQREKNDAQIARIREEIKFCEATSRACDMFEQLLIGLITSCRADLTHVASAEAPSPDGVVTDTEMLKKICVCGCQDEEDSRSCKCSCHQGVPCGNPQCVVCAAAAIQAMASATGATSEVVLEVAPEVKEPEKKPRRVRLNARRNQTS